MEENIKNQNLTGNQDRRIDELSAKLNLIEEYLFNMVKVEKNQPTNVNHTEYINQYLADVEDIIKKIDKKEINKAINILFDAWKNDKHVYFMGCGGSAGTASHFAADLSKTTMCKGKKRFKSISLVDNPSLTTAWINDEGWENVFKGQIENFMQPGDVVVGLSVHGGSGKGNALAWSQNLTKAMQYVKDNGGKAIGIAGFDGGAFKEITDACIIVPKDSTPLVEGFHGDLQHLIIFKLKEMIAEYK
jgi:D-sedoheptulose 7-phosphate isomerase